MRAHLLDATRIEHRVDQAADAPVRSAVQHEHPRSSVARYGTVPATPVFRPLRVPVEFDGEPGSRRSSAAFHIRKRSSTRMASGGPVRSHAVERRRDRDRCASSDHGDCKEFPVFAASMVGQRVRAARSPSIGPRSHASPADIRRSLRCNASGARPGGRGSVIPVAAPGQAIALGQHRPVPPRCRGSRGAGGGRVATQRGGPTVAAPAR